MKNTFRLHYSLVILSFAGIFSGCAASQETTAPVINKEIIEAKNFVFVAQNANPQRGRNIFLTTYYDVKVSPDTLAADLPYFGRAFSAPVDPAGGGIRFTTTEFEYTVKPRKRKGWDVIIKPAAGTGVQQFYFNIYDNGNAYLQVTSTNRTPISFTGKITERKGPAS